ncbi:hypothetical protein PFISCL1PPCAC_9438, partial [Pristionchus fissidentatus]
MLNSQLIYQRSKINPLPYFFPIALFPPKKSSIGFALFVSSFSSFTVFLFLFPLAASFFACFSFISFAARKFSTCINSCLILAGSSHRTSLSTSPSPIEATFFLISLLLLVLSLFASSTISFSFSFF